MVNDTWIIAIAQISATFVAIVSAFFTTKIVSISSEKGNLKRRIRAIDAEINAKEDMYCEYDEERRQIWKGWAEKDVSEFVKSLSKIPTSLNELIEEFEQYKDEGSDEFEISALIEVHQTFEDVKKFINSLSELPTSEKEFLEEFRQYKSLEELNEIEMSVLSRVLQTFRDVKKFINSLSELPTSEKEFLEKFKQYKSLEELDEIEVGLLSVSFQTLKESGLPSKIKGFFPYSKLMVLPFGRMESVLSSSIKVKREAERVKYLNKECDRIENELFVLKAIKNEYERQLEYYSFPKFIKFGFFSQVYFAFVGVVVPLSYRYWILCLGKYAQYYQEIIFIVFVSGLVLMFLYLMMEIWQSIKTGMG